MVAQQQATQWYDNKQLYEQIQSLKDQIAELNVEMQKTTTLLRGYNGLRERIDDCEIAIAKASAKAEGNASGSKDTWGYIIGALGIGAAIISAWKG